MVLKFLKLELYFSIEPEGYIYQILHYLRQSNSLYMFLLYCEIYDTLALKDCSNREKPISTIKGLTLNKFTTFSRLNLNDN